MYTYSVETNDSNDNWHVTISFNYNPLRVLTDQLEVACFLLDVAAKGGRYSTTNTWLNRQGVLEYYSIDPEKRGTL